MKEGPDIALLGSLIGDPARANILLALMSGKALTATELSKEAGITLQTASSHLKKLDGAGLISMRKQGRHRYFALSDEEIGQLLEMMMGVAAKRGHLRTRTGPKDPALRKARICYDHLAGDYGVQMFDHLKQNGFVRESETALSLTKSGEVFFADFGIDISDLKRSRRPLCKSCLDWSNRRMHLAGTLGQALLDRIIENGWANRIEGTRIIDFTRSGETAFLKCFDS